MSNKIKKWEELSRETIFQKYGRGTEKVNFRLPDGKESDFYIKKENPTLTVLALTKDNQVILARQFRPGPSEILNELPGGYVDENETPEQAAKRELLEETGYQGNIKLVSESFHCAYSTMRRYSLVATDCEKVANQKLSDNEFAEVILLSLDEFRELLRSGKMTNVETGYLGLDYLKLL